MTTRDEKRASEEQLAIAHLQQRVREKLAVLQHSDALEKVDAMLKARGQFKGPRPRAGHTF